MPTDMRRFQALTATGSVEIGVVPRFERMDNAMPADMRKMPAANTAILSIQPRCDIAVGYLAIFQQSQAESVLESKMVPLRMPSSTSCSERTSGCTFSSGS